MYFLLNLTLAVAYDSYRRRTMRTVTGSLRRRREVRSARCPPPLPALPPVRPLAEPLPRYRCRHPCRRAGTVRMHRRTLRCPSPAARRPCRWRSVSWTWMGRAC